MKRKKEKKRSGQKRWREGTEGWRNGADCPILPSEQSSRKEDTVKRNFSGSPLTKHSGMQGEGGKWRKSMLREK